MKTTETRTDTNIQETLCLNSVEHPLGGSEREQHVSVYVGGTCALSLSLSALERMLLVTVYISHTERPFLLSIWIYVSVTEHLCLCVHVCNLNSQRLTTRER